MAKPKSPKPPKPAKPEKPTSKPKSRSDNVIARLLADQPALDDVQRAAFAKRFSTADCEAAGGRTKSEGVLSDATSWAASMAKALKKHGKALRRYQGGRFTHFLECLRALADEREVQSAADGAAVAKVKLARALENARAASAELVETLEALFEGDAESTAALAEATAGADTTDGRIATLRALAKLGRQWLSREDAESKALVASAGLTAAECEAAERAADALTEASSDKTIAGQVVSRDTPAINRVEGRVLLEMRAAMRIFAAANAGNKEVPKLVPGKATRAFLAPPSKKKGKDAPEPVTPPNE